MLFSIFSCFLRSLVSFSADVALSSLTKKIATFCTSVAVLTTNVPGGWLVNSDKTVVCFLGEACIFSFSFSGLSGDSVVLKLWSDNSEFSWFFVSGNAGSRPLGYDCKPTCRPSVGCECDSCGDTSCSSCTCSGLGTGISCTAGSASSSASCTIPAYLPGVHPEVVAGTYMGYLVIGNQVRGVLVKFMTAPFGAIEWHAMVAHGLTTGISVPSRLSVCLVSDATCNAAMNQFCP